MKPNSAPVPFRFEADAAAVADLHARLDRTRYADEVNDAQQSWGLSGATLRGLLYHWRHAFDVIAAHFNMMVPTPPAGEADPMLLVQPHEHAWLAAAKAYRDDGQGYYHLQRTRPQTLAHALTDSPAGWCAWVAEKFQAWSDCERAGVRDVRHALSWDSLLTNVSLYWFTGTIASSLRLYREATLESSRGASPAIGRLTVPVGVANYPGEILRSPRAWVERQCPLVHWFEAPRGGHFAAMEQPQTFAEDLWRFKHRVLGSSS